MKDCKKEKCAHYNLGDRNNCDLVAWGNNVESCKCLSCASAEACSIKEYSTQYHGCTVWKNALIAQQSAALRLMAEWIQCNPDTCPVWEKYGGLKDIEKMRDAICRCINNLIDYALNKAKEGR